MTRPFRMPVLFLGHGSPMNAIEENEFSSAWRALSARFPPPKAILVISAHWVTHGTRITAMERPKTIHDFFGFHETLYEMEYAAPGAPALAARIARRLGASPIGVSVGLDKEWGLDHGAWSVLVHLSPGASIPVLQLSLDEDAPLERHLAIGKELEALRDEGILLIGSGNIVHNLLLMDQRAAPFAWAQEFDEKTAAALEAGDTAALIGYERLPSAEYAVPTNEHYLPLLYAVGAADGEQPEFLTTSFVYGSLSMRGVAYGLPKKSP